LLGKIYSVLSSAGFLCFFPWFVIVIALIALGTQRNKYKAEIDRQIAIRKKLIHGLEKEGWKTIGEDTTSNFNFK